MVRRRFSVISACALLPLLGGCKSCRNEHPYVPYTIDEAGPPSPVADEDAALPAVADAAAFAERPAIVPPPEATRWTLEGLDIAAPAERVFALGLTADIDGDGARDAIAVVRRTGAALDLGELVLYRGNPGAGGVAPAATIASPPQAALDPTCGATQRLAQVGRHSVVVELGATCAGHGPTPPPRWLAVVAIAPQPRVSFSAVLVDPPNAPKLTLDIDGSDRDGDGLDDVALRVTLEGGGAPFEPAPKASALLRWFDRPAGMGRDPGEPDASLRTLSGVANARAARAKDAPSVALQARIIRSLYSAICIEGGSPRITEVLGARAIACGPSRAVEEAGLAEVRAATTMGDPLRAIAALDRAQLPPATRTAARTNDATTWITQAAPVAMATQVRALAAVPQIERGRAPSWAALAFEASGKLLVRTLAGVVRVDPMAGDEAAAEDVPAWRTGVVSPDGASRWIEAYDPCDAFALHATFAPAGADGEARDVVLPIAPPLGTKCAATGAHGEPAAALPIAWGARGLEAIVAGEPLLFAPDLSRATLAVASLDQPVTAGAPRSPNGKVLVVPTSQGILTRGSRARLLRARELEGGYLELRDCVVSDDATRVACVRGGRAFVGIWDPSDAGAP